jgi:hypothetical protein
MREMLGDLGFTVTLGTAGALALIVGHRRLAGLLWAMLGTGAVGVAFDRMTEGDLRFAAAKQPDEAERRFLVGHLPFFVMGLWLLLTEDQNANRRLH